MSVTQETLSQGASFSSPSLTNNGTLHSADFGKPDRGIIKEPRCSRVGVEAVAAGMLLKHPLGAQHHVEEFFFFFLMEKRVKGPGCISRTSKVQGGKKDEGLKCLPLQPSWSLLVSGILLNDHSSGWKVPPLRGSFSVPAAYL